MKENDIGDTIKGFHISGPEYYIDIISVSGKFRGKGAALAFITLRDNASVRNL